MSGTTITVEERARLRSVLSEHGNPQVEDRIILRLLNTIEQAEARAENAEKELAGADAEITELRDELEDSRGTEKDAPNVLCAIARLVGVYEHSQELGDDMGTLVFEAVSDLLAEKQKYAPRALRWTNEPPKVAGPYYVRPRENIDKPWSKPRIVSIKTLTIAQSEYWQFAGPIAPPID